MRFKMNGIESKPLPVPKMNADACWILASRLVKNWLLFSQFRSVIR